MIKKKLRMALAGQPNVGKSTVFNMLTGLNQHVGNWPGKTIDLKSGRIRHRSFDIRITDLPGTYSLTCNSEEERIARDFILEEKPDVVIVIVNAAALEHSLYLVTELLELPPPIVIGLNMIDVAKQNGVVVESHVLQAALGVPVVPLVATRKQGIQDLLKAAISVLEDPTCFHPVSPGIEEEHQDIYQRIVSILRKHKRMDIPPTWMAMKLLEGDSEITQKVKAETGKDWEVVQEMLKRHEDVYLDIASHRYKWIRRMIRAAVVHPKGGQISFTDRLDRFATHPVWGMMMILLLFSLVLWLTYTIALPIVTLFNTYALGGLENWLGSVMSSTPAWLQGLVIDGVLRGTGTVISFVPILIIYFLALGFLEDTGYLARVAYVLDRYLHAIGLHGKSSIPLCMGVGCNVPAVMGCRIIEDWRAKILTILLVPFIPCTSRMAVITFLAAAFFGKAATLVTISLLAASVFILMLVGFLTNRTVFKGQRTAFIMEMPLYHVPNLRTIGLFIYRNTISFLQKAGTIILVVSVGIWFLGYMPSGKIETSWLAHFGTAVTPAFALVGLPDWRFVVALFTSFLAKENTVATLGILFTSGAGGTLSQQIAPALSLPSRLAFITMQTFFIPCLPTVLTIRQESHSWRWAWLSIGIMLTISLLLGAAVYYLAMLFTI
jgi:ferrous iron transport protein B